MRRQRNGQSAKDRRRRSNSSTGRPTTNAATQSQQQQQQQQQNVVAHCWTALVGALLFGLVVALGLMLGSLDGPILLFAVNNDGSFPTQHRPLRQKRPPRRYQNDSLQHRRELQVQHAVMISLEEDLWNIGNMVVDRQSDDVDVDAAGGPTAVFCAPWTVNVDAWWSQHPTWELALQNATHQCLHRIVNPAQRQLYERLYAIQFPSKVPSSSSASFMECPSYIPKYISGSGWGADVSHVVDGLELALARNVLVRVLTPTPWQYAFRVPACPRADWSCYFLPLSGCDTQPRTHDTRSTAIRYQQPWYGFAPANRVTRDDDDTNNIPGTVPWLLQYATRPQTWLRQRVVQAMVESVLVSPRSTPPWQPPTLPWPCTVMHVRRGDVVLHGKFSRRYHAIREYVQALEQYNNNSNLHSGATTQEQINQRQNILLLTDDANAVTEALTEYSNNDKYQWFYLDRPRHQADEGGWENQIPSGDPVSEVVLLLAELELASQCQTLVHSKSNLADYLYAVMTLAQQQQQHYASDQDVGDDNAIDAVIERIDLDESQPHDVVHQAANADSVRLSTAFG